MDVQVPHQVMLLPQSSSVANVSVAQAKAALLELGEQVQQERRERPPLLRRYSMWISVIAAFAGAAIPVIGALRSQPPKFGRRERRSKAMAGGFSLGLLLKLLRPAIPFIMRFMAQRRQARSTSASSNGAHSRFSRTAWRS